MKLTLSLLVLFATICVCSFAYAGIVHETDPLYAGMNMFTLRGVPVIPDPAVILAGQDLDHGMYRWDAALQSQFLYDSWVPENFGNLLLSDGYFLFCADAGTYEYDTLSEVDSMDIWISLPKAGWSLIGNPYSYPTSWDNAKVTDGNVTVSMQEAAKTNFWLQSVGFWWNAVEQSQYDMGITEDWSYTTDMPVKHGVWILSYIDKLAIILEAAPPP